MKLVGFDAASSLGELYRYGLGRGETPVNRDRTVRSQGFSVAISRSVLISRTPRRGGRFLARSLLVSALYAALSIASPPTLSAQVPAPDAKHLFREDAREVERRRQRVVGEALRADPAASEELDFEAPQVEFDQERNVLRGTGGIVVSRGGLRAQAEQAEVDVETEAGVLQGDVLVTGGPGVVRAETGEFDFASETGIFFNAEILEEQRGYRARADVLRKLSDFEYEFDEVKFTTCDCDEDDWVISANEGEVTYGGYAHTYGTTLELFDVPLFYTPYLGFPVKNERQTGLLFPTFGGGGEDGFMFQQPIFFTLGDSHDLTLAPFVETETRWGSAAEIRSAFSLRNRMRARWVYSNERLRDGDLRGLVVDGLFDPSIDEDRFGGLYSHIWQSSPDALIPTQFLADVHYVSDDLFLRELEERDIGERNSLYTVSTVMLRSQLTSALSASLMGEYNQALVTNDDYVFQRVPQFELRGSKTFRPFGFNPYGLKLVTRGRAQVVNFMRDGKVDVDGARVGLFDGTRADVAPSLSVPFHYKNYFNAEIYGGVRGTWYRLDDTFDPRTNSFLADSENRKIFNVGYSMSTAVERVFELPEENWLTTLTSIGVDNQATKLRRLKHVIEPLFRYDYVPDVSQDNLPLFDSVDRVRNRSMFTYGVRSVLLGRFLPRYSGAERLTELTPRLEELPLIEDEPSVYDGEMFGDTAFGAPVSLRMGEIRELVTLSLLQTYDYMIDRDDISGVDPFSDIGARLSILPTKNFALSFESNFDPEEQDFSSWGLSTGVTTDRGDALRTRITYFEDRLSQVEGNLEIVLNEYAKIGYYGHYDEVEREFIENRVGLRFSNPCDCWSIELGYHELLNPDREVVSLTFTFAGLGDITQGLSLANRANNN